MSLSRPRVEKVRLLTVGFLSPFWQGLEAVRDRLSQMFKLPDSGEGVSESVIGELERLSQENQLLQVQIQNVREWLLLNDRVEAQIEQLKLIKKEEEKEGGWRTFFHRRNEELSSRIELQVCSVPACVVFREPSSWGSYLWINLGEADNGRLGKRVIGKHSPVLSGTSIVGIVDQVGSSRSRVRLITDSHLCPSVRVLRGQEQNRFLLEHLEMLIFALERRDDLLTLEEMRSLLKVFEQVQTKLVSKGGDLYLAKGELFGSSRPLWRSRNQTLKGVGFNYDFPDEEGPARELFSGRPYGFQKSNHGVSLIQRGDILVTTGFDGIFPPGFRVGVVSFVQPLKEGASSYEIEAVSTAGNLDELKHLNVLPPL